jgi:predicted nucleotidyltransferase
MKAVVDIDKISDMLKEDENILFALVFGSGAKGEMTVLSDIDIGIYTKDEMDLLEMGRLLSRLEKVVRRKVDLVILNDLYKKRPGFSFKVISSARLLFVRDRSIFVNFKKNVFLYYMDARPLIEMVRKSVKRRIETGTLGERNFSFCRQ